MQELRMSLSLQFMKMTLRKIAPIVLSKLREEGINFEPDNGSELLPIVTVEVDDESMDLNKALLASLLDLEDVDAVCTDQK
ncbi:hypothetical protein SAY86_013704 [Trapa natans]|uniref:Uncharacterized protein n=1 Tax=Trapa natans TaxID=22666 RepID=A0AAN7KV20_TRANT|nr:hypothetical protein SAY86_013704 [Trapa natans]